MLFIFPRLALTLCLAFVGYKASSEIDYVCEVVMDMSIAAYGIAFIPICIFLWLRQRILYSQHFLRELYSQLVRFFSWSLIICLLSGIVLTGVFYVLPIHYAGSKHGCVNTSSGTYNEPSYAASAIQVFGQGLLLLLFLYPLWVHKKFQITAFQGSKKRVCVGSGPGFQDRVLGTMKRTLYCTLACLVSDVIAMVASTFIIAPDIPRFATNVVYDVNLTINALFVLLSFESRRKIFTSLLKWKVKK